CRPRRASNPNTGRMISREEAGLRYHIAPAACRLRQSHLGATSRGQRTKLRPAVRAMPADGEGCHAFRRLCGCGWQAGIRRCLRRRRGACPGDRQGGGAQRQLQRLHVGGGWAAGGAAPMNADLDARLDAIMETAEQAARLWDYVLMELNELRRDTMRAPRQIPTPIERKAA